MKVNCFEGKCHGFNERVNIWRAGQHFVRLFLPLSAPASLEPHVRDLLSAYEHPGIWDTTTILAATKQLVHKYAAGDYFSSAEMSVSSLGESSLFFIYYIIMTFNTGFQNLNLCFN